MKAVLLGLGSNIEPESHLQWAAQQLRRQFGEVRFSAVYRSPAVGMDGDDFLNACCLLHSDRSLHELRALFKQWEDARGRDRSQGSWKPRTLDIDVLMYDGEIIDDGLLTFAHAYVPASELVVLAAASPDVSMMQKTDLNL